MSEERCESCRFWDYSDDAAYRICHRYPPVLCPKKDQMRDEADSRVGIQPWTQKDDWCGEYQARVPLGMVQISPKLDFGPPDVGAKVGMAMAAPGE